MKLPIKGVLALLPMALFAGSYPPYEIYNGTTSGNPKLVYTKVCEPGRTGETKASYVILGSYYPAKPALANTAYDGDLVIPSKIAGLPVRKINDAAFITCTKLRSVRVPSTVREIGERAFSDCWLLTNITFEAGVAAIGDGAFSNCLSIASITFPKTLASLGAQCFYGCTELRNVYFLGNAPRLIGLQTTDKSFLGESIYRNNGYYERFKVHIRRNTYGWISPYEKGVPEKWPVDFGYMQAHETVAEDGGGTQAEDTGFVAVITEIKGGAVAVPATWAAKFPSYAAKFGSDFTASLTKPTGKKYAVGNDLQVWQDYVAGTDPTDLNDVFRAEITVVNDMPAISWSPVLPAVEEAKRTYVILGRQSLLSGDWIEVPPGQERNYNFFKVTVELK